MARRSDQTKPFSEYIISVELKVRRKSGHYDSDMVADVHAEETLTMKPADLPSIFRSMVAEAQGKAVSAMGIRDRFEADMLALEAGDTIGA